MSEKQATKKEVMKNDDKVTRKKQATNGKITSSKWVSNKQARNKWANYKRVRNSKQEMSKE